MRQFVRRWSHRLREAQHFNPGLLNLLERVLRGRSWLARILNMGLWATYHLLLRCQRMYHRLKQRPHIQQVERSTTQPWHDALTVNGVNQGVLIIAELAMPQCRRYRVEQKVEGFKALGIRCDVVSWTDLEPAFERLQTAKTVIFYRVPATPELLALAEEAKRLKMIRFFDIDDLVFDLDVYRQNSNLIDLPKKEQAELLKGGQLYCDMLMACDHAIASTPTLKHHMERFCPGEVLVVENALDNRLLQLAEKPSGMPASQRIVIGYGSGTRTHNADFLLVSAALVRLMQQYPQVELAVYGHLTLADEFEAVAERIHKVPFIEAQDYYQAMRRFDINLAPLEPGPFNDAKSNIKFIEASVFRIPTVASPAAAFKQVICSGENGFLAETEAEWFDALEALVLSTTLRQRIGEAAHRTAVEQYAIPIVADQQLKPVLSLAHHPEMPLVSTQRHVVLVNVLFAPMSLGGATVVAEQLAEQLNQRGDTRVTVITGCFDTSLALGEVRQYRWHDLTVFAVRIAGGSMEQDYDSPLVTQAFDRILTALQPDIVHFHSIQMMGVGMLECCLAQQLPYLITLHDAWWLCEKQFMVNADGYCGQAAIDPLVCAQCVDHTEAMLKRRFRLQPLLNQAARLLAPSEFQRDLYVQSGTSSERTLVNKNGISHPLSSPENLSSTEDRALQRAGQPLVFAFMGGRAEHKGYFWLKQIIEQLDSDQYELRLIDVTARVTHSEMQQEHWNAKGQVNIVPPFDPDQLDDFFAEIDVLLFPSQWKESFGLTVREAMIRDIWVITTDCGGPAEDLIDGENGHLVAMDDAAGFKAAIEACLSNPEHTRRYQNPHKDRIRRFADQADELSGIIDEVLTAQRQQIPMMSAVTAEASTEHTAYSS
ncbi:hypothetical protein BFW38_16170 [Terasakiispira papahanaumokuakeensis]|uniref:Glycosyl transferase n=1 Tax=Terasakiispira papahanaumokuakeensis TaxID=197479 RepID=A0A1E2VDE3_9GAMM|nr:glycosyltransferase [Terasakiispira papahanaumokuakeensis]ODC04836.1 hypothetical protein BFW38_16170 [Terasakiispira papahanaumokuakeensis]